MNDKANTLPGFTAASALYRTSHHYRLTWAPDALGYHSSGESLILNWVQPSAAVIVGEGTTVVRDPTTGDEWVITTDGGGGVSESPDLCQGYENDPESFSHQIAAHYRRDTEGGREPPRLPSITCPPSSRLCEVTYSDGVVVVVLFAGLEQRPKYVTADRRRPPGGKRCRYSYSCDRIGNISFSACREV
jgi:hypothetical protein